jgi:hypothetical protein
VQESQTKTVAVKDEKKAATESQPHGMTAVMKDEDEKKASTKSQPQERERGFILLDHR